MKFRHVVTTVVVSACTALLSVFIYAKYFSPKTSVFTSQANLPVNYAGAFDKAPGEPVDFEQAAASAVPAVVHITTKTNPSQASNNLPKKNPFFDFFGDDLFDQFFGDNNKQRRTIPQMASGSGVLISEDGYIITNNHVIDGADEISISLNNKKKYTGKLIAVDPSTDLAVVKIDAKGLPYLLYGNSDDVKLGQWVLAIGYPLTLETTVTAGIVSAKARFLDINRRQSATPIESFIQTDAAVNQGNSGGALINTNGELIGINSAIASPTGVYAGYSYAIPVNIVKKIVNDLIQYGTVQRAFLGIQYPNERLSDEQKKDLGFKEGEGVYVMEVASDGAATDAGIKKGDYITKINGTTVNSGPEMVEQVARYKPGDKITVTYKRGTDYKTVNMTLKNKSGNYDLVTSTVLDKLGVDFKTIDKKTASANGIEGGVEIAGIHDGIISDQTTIRKGFIIIRADGKEVKSTDELKSVLQNSGKSVIIEGIYPGAEGVYQYGLNDLGN